MGRRSGDPALTAGGFDKVACDMRELRPISPIDMAIASHRFINERVQAGIVFLQRFTSSDWMRSIIWRGFLTGGIEICDDAFGPIFGGIMDSRGSFPQTFALRCFEQFFHFVSKLKVQPFDPKFV